MQLKGKSVVGEDKYCYNLLLISRFTNFRRVSKSSEHASSELLLSTDVCSRATLSLFCTLWNDNMYKKLQKGINSYQTPHALLSCHTATIVYF